MLVTNHSNNKSAYRIMSAYSHSIAIRLENIIYVYGHLYNTFSDPHKDANEPHWDIIYPSDIFVFDVFYGKHITIVFYCFQYFISRWMQCYVHSKIAAILHPFAYGLRSI